MPEIRHFPESLIPAPKPVQFRCEEFNARTEFQPHSHTWGQLMWVKAGVMVLRIGGQRFLAPPEFVLWAPAGIEHSCYNQRLAQCRMVDITPALCAGMPADPCLVSVTPIFRAIAEDFYARKQYIPQTEEDLRLCQVLIDQLRLSPRQQTYLPSSDDKFWRRCWKRWSTARRTTPRWRRGRPGLHHRAHAVAPLPAGSGHVVQRMAPAPAFPACRVAARAGQDRAGRGAGYSSASAFIVMFQQIAGTTPERFRRA